MSSQSNQLICAYHIGRLSGSFLNRAISVLEVASFHAHISPFFFGAFLLNGGTSEVSSSVHVRSWVGLAARIFVRQFHCTMNVYFVLDRALLGVLYSGRMI